MYGGFGYQSCYGKSMKKYHDGHELEFGCHDGKCWAYCGASWTRLASTKYWGFTSSVKTWILVANGVRPVCMVTMAKQLNASQTAIALIKSIIALDRVPFLINKTWHIRMQHQIASWECNITLSATNCYLSNKTFSITRAYKNTIQKLKTSDTAVSKIV